MAKKRTRFLIREIISAAKNNNNNLDDLISVNATRLNDAGSKLRSKEMFAGISDYDLDLYCVTTAARGSIDLGAKQELEHRGFFKGDCPVAPYEVNASLQGRVAPYNSDEDGADRDINNAFRRSRSNSTSKVESHTSLNSNCFINGTCLLNTVFVSAVLGSMALVVNHLMKNMTKETFLNSLSENSNGLYFDY